MILAALRICFRLRFGGAFFVLKFVFISGYR